MIYGNAVPVIVSDRAISGRSNLGKVILPTTGRKTTKDTPVVEFRVKSIIIKDILCVVFSGRVSEIERAREDIIDYFLYRKVNIQTFTDFMAQVILEPYTDISVLYALGGPELDNNRLMVFQLGKDWLKNNSKEKLNIIACGTGASEWIGHFVEHQSYMQPSSNPEADCKQRALIACIKYISKEMQSDDQLHEGWGGGFDIIYYKDKKFHRYDQVAYVFLYVKEENPESIALVSINHNRYKDDNALVLNIDRGMDFNYTIVPQFRNNEPIDATELPLACVSWDIGVCIFIKKKDGRLATLVAIPKEVYRNSEPMLIAGKLEGEPLYKFKTSFEKKLREDIKSYL